MDARSAASAPRGPADRDDRPPHSTPPMHLTLHPYYSRSSVRPAPVGSADRGRGRLSPFPR